MTENEIKKIKAAILLEIEETKEKIIDLEELTIPIPPDCSIGRLTRMEAMGSKSVNEEALRIAQNRMYKLEFALSQIERNDYGNCQKCGQPIPFNRLLFVPESSYCVHCS